MFILFATVESPVFLQITPQAQTSPQAQASPQAQTSPQAQITLQGSRPTSPPL
jgi:hypothetical protein